MAYHHRQSHPTVTTRCISAGNELFILPGLKKLRHFFLRRQKRSESKRNFLGSGEAEISSARKINFCSIFYDRGTSFRSFSVLVCESICRLLSRTVVRSVGGGCNLFPQRHRKRLRSRQISSNFFLFRQFFQTIKTLNYFYMKKN